MTEPYWGVNGYDNLNGDEPYGSNNNVLQDVRGVARVVNRKRRRLWALSAAAAGSVVLAVSMVVAQTPTASPVAKQSVAALADNAAASSARQAEIPAILSRSASATEKSLPPPPPNEHPLLPVLRWAKQGLPAIESLKDYSATLVRRERIHGKLSSYEHLFIKIRHAPFSVYAYFQAPAVVKGQEVIYVAGQNQGNILAHKARMAVTVSLHPDGLIAMSGRHYPITEIGLVNLVRRLVEVGQQDVRYGECEVKYFNKAKINQRSCTVIQVVHPLPRDVFRFHLARVFVDDELKVPIRYESYDWPSEAGGEPRLIEEYTYLDLKLNNGFTDEDFSTQNPEYRFR